MAVDKPRLFPGKRDASFVTGEFSANARNSAVPIIIRAVFALYTA